MFISSVLLCWFSYGNKTDFLLQRIFTNSNQCFSCISHTVSLLLFLPAEGTAKAARFFKFYRLGTKTEKEKNQIKHKDFWHLFWITLIWSAIAERYFKQGCPLKSFLLRSPNLSHLLLGICWYWVQSDVYMYINGNSICRMYWKNSWRLNLTAPEIVTPTNEGDDQHSRQYWRFLSAL